MKKISKIAQKESTRLAIASKKLPPIPKIWNHLSRDLQQQLAYQISALIQRVRQTKYSSKEISSNE